MPLSTPLSFSMIRERVRNAINAVVRERPTLFHANVTELAVAHRLALYLQKEFADTDLYVDCEYNRHLLEKKKILARKVVRPDIVIHERETDAHNFLVFEIKTKDKTKLKRFTGTVRVYGYDYGIFILFKSGVPKDKWFHQGIELEESLFQ